MSIRLIKVSDNDDGQRIDRWLKKTIPDVPYGMLQKLMRKGALRVDGKRVKTDTRLVAGQEVKIPSAISDMNSFHREKPKLSDKDAAFIKSLVLHDDGDVIAINKPAGLAVQGGSKTFQHVDGMLDGLADKDGVKPKLVHRLDKDTSGALLLARSTKVARGLGNSFKKQSVRKIYIAMVHGVPEALEGTIKAPLIKAGGLNKERMRVDHDEGKYAATDYIVMDRAGTSFSLVAFWPRTGRTHQIRAHAEIAGMPIVGDNKYRGTSLFDRTESEVDLAERLHLHALRLILDHPTQKQGLDITAPMPKDLQSSLRAVGFDPAIKHDPFADSV